MSKKILVISQYFYPENFRINHLVLELKQRGYEVTVLTGLPNYPQGEYYEGYGPEKNCDEIWNGIKIYRCKLRARYMGSVNLVRNYISFVTEANKKLKELRDEHFDVIYVFEVSPMTVALPAVREKKRRNIPLIINIQDLWPENVIAVTGVNNPVVNFFINRMVNYIYKYCDLILAASKSFVPRIQSRVNEKKKVIFWPQYSVVSREEKKRELFDPDKFNIVFTGNVGEAQGLDLMVEAADKLSDPPISWHIVGDGRYLDTLKEKVKEKNLEEIIFFYGRRPESEIPQYLACAQAALLILKPDPVFEMTLPAKLQTYMACGVPIIGCVSGEGKKTIDEAKAGLTTSEISVKALVSVCQDILSLEPDEYSKLAMQSFAYGQEYFDKDSIITYLSNQIDNPIQNQ